MARPVSSRREAGKCPHTSRELVEGQADVAVLQALTLDPQLGQLQHHELVGNESRLGATDPGPPIQGLRVGGWGQFGVVSGWNSGSEVTSTTA